MLFAQALLLLYQSPSDPTARPAHIAAYVVLALIVIGLAKWLFFPTRRGRECPRCGRGVKIGVLDCPHCGFDFRSVGTEG